MVVSLKLFPLIGTAFFWGAARSYAARDGGVPPPLRCARPPKRRLIEKISETFMFQISSLFAYQGEQRRDTTQRGDAPLHTPGNGPRWREGKVRLIDRCAVERLKQRRKLPLCHVEVFPERSRDTHMSRRFHRLLHFVSPLRVTRGHPLDLDAKEHL